MQEILRSSLVGDSLISEAREAKEQAEIEAELEAKIRAKIAAENVPVEAAADANGNDVIKQLLPLLLATSMSN